MPPRRSHKKSRAGCKRCKSRKIKCDEVHPRCGNCVKHGVPCDFENPDMFDELLTALTPSNTAASQSPIDRASSTAPSPSAGASHRAKTPSVSGGSPPTASCTPLYTTPANAAMSATTAPNNRLLELRLMHQFTSMTSRTLVVNTPATHDIWQNTVPRLAFGGASYLADAMLAVAALHLRSFNPDDKALVRASHSYMASALAAYCSCLQNGITEANAESLFLTAALIAFSSTATRIFIRDEADPNDPASAYSLPLSWFHAFQGVKTVVATSWPWIRNSGIVIPIIDSQPVLQLDLDATSPTSFFGKLLDNLEDELQGEDAIMAMSTRQSYQHAVAVLNWAHKLPHRGAALAFPATVSKRFIELLEERRPRALTILACFFALLKGYESAVWWLEGVSRREVMGIVSQFEATSPWWAHLEWPVRIALYKHSIIPPEVWGSDWVTEESKAEKGHNMTAESFVNHIEILTGVFAKAQPQMPVPVSTHAV
ncbi:Sterol uptake control protein 2 [Colletotrichum siamense]|nr:Sterol uptake control protein 2 [Colletotrichum siamense]KAI8174210.1 Sterol uptake control protein 2 [Colletotrichum sp. SAR 10_75]KAI8198863.1 Sterol uptake control protein 2 [Colletotrichum sp. SAR 10_65]KAI8205729.1 Sterol uptake control protein 2 [Colletotrichum sp. SAR 10_76]KAI8220823.1 Sterol uptake control protein 2 [Colletotrichum sp. SAR 10_77]KAI8253288.1 Sterol uptake control protein 2 [Colletotrichum sp. SAR11_239]